MQAMRERTALSRNDRRVRLVLSNSLRDRLHGPGRLIAIIGAGRWQSPEG